MAKGFSNFAKVAIFCQIWAHWSALQTGKTSSSTIKRDSFAAVEIIN